MKGSEFIVLGLICVSPHFCRAQQTLPDAPAVPTKTSGPAPSTYSPPTQSERFKTYWLHTFGVTAILEAGVRGGIEQARDTPSGWPQGAEGYGDRFGSSMGQIAIRGTTQYLVADLFKEDLRFIPCRSSCPASKFKAALEDTFLARKGDDGHRAFSVARLFGPWTGSVVAINAWYPSGYGGREVIRQAGLSYGLGFFRNYIRELAAR